MSTKTERSDNSDSDWVEIRKRDRKLVSDCLAGSEEAWAEVWGLYGPLVKATARRLGCGDDEVSEVLQRTALVALQGLERLREPEKLAGWLAGIARFQVIELRRAQRPFTEVTEAVVLEREDAETALMREEETAQLYAALTALDSRCRRIVTRLELSDPPASYTEVADEVGLAPTSIGPIRRRCLKRLRKLFEMSRMRR